MKQEMIVITCIAPQAVRKERKGKEEYLYSAILVRIAQTRITQFYLQITPCLPVVCQPDALP